MLHYHLQQTGRCISAELHMVWTAVTAACGLWTRNFLGTARERSFLV